MKYTILPLSEEQIRGAGFVESQCLDTAWSESQIAEMITNKNALYLTAVAHGRVCGILSVYLVCGEGQIINLAVLPEHRRHGAASMLMCEAERMLCEQKAETVTLEVSCENTGAIAFYEKWGFVTVGTRKGFYYGTDAHILEKKL